MKTKKIIILFVAIGLLFSGCKKNYLQLSNPNLQTTATFWQTEDEAVLGVNGIYHALGYDGTFMRFAPACLDSRDDITWSPSPWDAFFAVAQFNLAVTNYMPEAMYVAHYDLIKRANAAIANIPSITFTVHPEYKNRLMVKILIVVMRNIKSFIIQLIIQKSCKK